MLFRDENVPAYGCAYLDVEEEELREAENSADDDERSRLEPLLQCRKHLLRAQQQRRRRKSSMARAADFLKKMNTYIFSHDRRLDVWRDRAPLSLPNAPTLASCTRDFSF